MLKYIDTSDFTTTNSGGRRTSQSKSNTNSFLRSPQIVKHLRVVLLSECRSVSGCAASRPTVPAGPDQEAVLYPSSSRCEGKKGREHGVQGQSSGHRLQTGVLWEAHQHRLHWWLCFAFFIPTGTHEVVAAGVGLSVSNLKLKVSKKGCEMIFDWVY